MRLIEMKCQNCAAPLEIDLDNLQVYCQYCGEKLMIDVENLGDILYEKEKTKQVTEETKKAQVVAEQKKHSNNTIVKVILIWLGTGFALLIALTIIGIIAFSRHADKVRKEHAEKNEIQVNVSSESLIGKNYHDVEEQLENQGFQNITSTAHNDLITGWLHSKGEVEVVKIAGDTEFYSTNWFPADARIEIIYHDY